MSAKLAFSRDPAALHKASVDLPAKRLMAQSMRWTSSASYVNRWSMTPSNLIIPIIETKRLRLEPLALRHSNGMFRMWRHPDVAQFSGAAEDQFGNKIQMPVETRHDSDRLIEFWLKAASDGWGFRWAIVRLEDGEFLGHLGFNSLVDCFEIAYHLAPDFWGHGFMREAAVPAITWARERGAVAIDAFIEPENFRSIALALKLCMRGTDTYLEGARRYHRLL